MPPPLPPITPAEPSGGPLSAAHYRELTEARLRAKKVRRAASVAAGSGWTMAFFGLVTVLGGIFGDVPALLMGLGLVALAINELAGAAMIKNFDPRGPRRLGYNQLALGVLIVVYAGWSLVANLRSPPLGEMSAELASSPEIGELVGQISTMTTWGLYGGMAIVGVIAPGLTALYYFRRGKIIREMVDNTPAWIIETMRATG